MFTIGRRPQPHCLNKDQRFIKGQQCFFKTPSLRVSYYGYTVTRTVHYFQGDPKKFLWWKSKKAAASPFQIISYRGGGEALSEKTFPTHSESESQDGGERKETRKKYNTTVVLCKPTL